VDGAGNHQYVNRWTTPVTPPIFVIHAVFVSRNIVSGSGAFLPFLTKYSLESSDRRYPGEPAGTMPPPPRILIVDDDTVITHIISLMLQNKGYNIVGKITSGEEAVIKSADLNPDLIIMDIGLSGIMNGVTAAYTIFQLFHFPIIFITGTDDEKILDHARYSQPYCIIFKPFKELELTTNVDLALYNHNIRKKSLAAVPIGEPDTIMGVNEVIIVLDTKGRIIFFNPYAAWFIDIPEPEIRMKYWRDILMLINDQTGEELVDPVHEAVQQTSVVRYDSNAAVVTTTGKRRKAGISLQPVMDDRGRLFALLMKIREKLP
jgi:two-component system, response regulator PdtaR